MFIKNMLRVFILFSLTLSVSQCGKVVTTDDPISPPLLSLDLVGFSPSTRAIDAARANGFLDPMEIIALVDNPKIALVWELGLDDPYSVDWTHEGTQVTDTMMFQSTSMELSWPFRMHVVIDEPPADHNLQWLKESPQSRVGMAAIVVFNDGNDNGRFDEYNVDTATQITCWGPYEHGSRGLPCPISLSDTNYSDSCASLTALKEDWIIAFTSSYAILYATDERACSWLNDTYSGKDIIDKKMVFEMKYDIHFMDTSLILSNSFTFFNGIQPGYSVVKAQSVSEFTDLSYTISERREFDKVTKRWKCFRLYPEPFDKFLVCKTFTAIDPLSEEIPLLVTDDDEVLWYQYILDGP